MDLETFSPPSLAGQATRFDLSVDRNSRTMEEGASRLLAMTVIPQANYRVGDTSTVGVVSSCPVFLSLMLGIR